MKTKHLTGFVLAISLSANILLANTIQKNSTDNVKIQYKQWWIQFDEAEKLAEKFEPEKTLIKLNEIIQLTQKLPGDNTQLMIKVKTLRAAMYEWLKKFDTAELELKQLLDMRLKRFGEDHVDYADGYFYLASFYYNIEEYDKSEVELKKAIDLMTKAEGEKYYALGSCFNLMASVKLYQGKYNESERYLAKSLEISNRNLKMAKDGILADLNDLLRVNQHQKDNVKISNTKKEIEAFKSKYLK